MASLTDPLAKKKGSTGNGIAVYGFENGRISAERFMPLAPRATIPAGKVRRDEFKDVTYPAGLSVGRSGGEERLLVASNNSDEAVLLNASDGKIIHRFDLSTMKRIPASLPYTTVMTKDGKRGFVSLWNASSVAELDLLDGRVVRIIPLRKPESPLAGGSHPTALLLNRENSRLYVALTNRDEIAVVDAGAGKVLSYFSTKLPGQKYGGSDPEYLALSSWTRRCSFPPMQSRIQWRFLRSLRREARASVPKPLGSFPQSGTRRLSPQRGKIYSLRALKEEVPGRNPKLLRHDA